MEVGGDAVATSKYELKSATSEQQLLQGCIAVYGFLAEKSGWHVSRQAKEGCAVVVIVA